MEETTFPLQCVTKVIGLETLDSTQDLAYELAQKGEPDGTLVLAAYTLRLFCARRKKICAPNRFACRLRRPRRTCWRMCLA